MSAAQSICNVGNQRVMSALDMGKVRSEDGVFCSSEEEVFRSED
jgi:hypothetical protein